ncbi:SurA N-terminal domain-containing protein [Szabonella alba]|uniref:SurA N-terminal domain-containing protein n=1 Tax=Szabonella alba TaxID=2804194 RepID=A0A8K0Y0N7_9RHOB|nr:SurA N-terminal domain-containing protein [Szabonella alba]MBL4917313.1 SurA N-terminal domain-containing protein [Szabonella alba]
MAKQQEETRRKKGKGTSVVVWVLMAMLVLGLGGFGVTNFGGGLTAIGSVGDRDITVNDYARALQQEINALSAQTGQRITVQQAQSFGLDRQVRQQLVNTAALDNENDRIGVSAGDARVAAEITQMESFRGTGGQFDRETYRFMLERNDLTETAFETRLRDDLARALLQGAVGSGFEAPPALVSTLFAHVTERRGYSLLQLTDADLGAPIPAPTDEDLTAFHSENTERFTRPEARRITYATLLPDDLAPDMEVDEDVLRRVYDERIDEFVQPERRLVERLVYPTAEAAEAAFARLETGATFEDLVEARGVTLDDIDLGDVSLAELGPAGEAVFALTEPGVVGPFESTLGPALFRMNAILSAQEVTFDEARDDLTAEVATDSARREIDARIEDIDDRLAGGATLEDLAAEAGMTLDVIEFHDGSDARIAGYPAFREAALAAQEGDFPEVVILGDGGIVALRLDAILPPAPIPLDDIRDEVAEAWRQAQLAAALSEKAIAVKSAVETGASLGAYGIVDVTAAATRSTRPANAPQSVIATLFTMEEPGQIRVVEAEGFTALLRLDSISEGDTEGDDALAVRRMIAVQAEQALAQDAFSLFVNGLSDNAGIRFDDAAVSAVHSQFQ